MLVTYVTEGNILIFINEQILIVRNVSRDNINGSIKIIYHNEGYKAIHCMGAKSAVWKPKTLKSPLLLIFWT